VKGFTDQLQKARRNFLLRRALRCRGDWIRTSDLLNPIQEATHPNSVSNQGDTPTGSSACTTACTNRENIEQPDPIAALAAALLTLSSAERTRLAAILLGQQEGG
jgi:hypothetical protein